MTEEDEEAVRKQVAVMGERGVRLLAIDNDLTLVSIHTVPHPFNSVNKRSLTCATPVTLESLHLSALLSSAVS